MICVRDKSATLTGTCRGLCRKVGIMEFGLNRSSKVVEFDTNRKCMCNFLLANDSNDGPILNHYDLYCSFFSENSY